MLFRNSTLRLPFALALLLFCTSAVAARVEGSWAGTFDAPGSLAAMRLKFTSQKDFADSKLMVNVYGRESVAPIQNFAISGVDVSFQAEVFKEQVKFFGKFQNNALAGSFELVADGRSISGQWSLRRVDDSVFSKPANTAPITPRGRVELPKPTGPFPVGRRAFYWTDETRRETITDDEGDRRKLFVQLWYPSRRGSTTAAPAVYYPDVEELQPKNPNLPVLRAIRTHAKVDAPLAKSRAALPLIIFSPGLGSSISNYTTIIENLASHGYVVAAINHAYDAGDFKFSDGQIIRYATSLWDRQVPASWTADARKKFFDERRIGWAADISFVVQQLTRLNGGLFNGRLDIANIGVLGHSFGGQAATIACAEDQRLKACANLDGLAQGNAFLPNSKGENLKQPFLFFTKNPIATDHELTIMGLSRREYDARDRQRMLDRWKPALKTRLEVLEQGSHFAVVRGATHGSFSDTPLLETNPTNETLAERQLRAKVINEYILAFFNKFLRKRNSHLLNSRNQPHPQVVVELLRK